MSETINISVKDPKWLNNLPQIISSLSDLWRLRDIIPAINISWNYIAYASQDDRSVVLKIFHQQDVFNDEVKALQHFDSNMIKLLDYNGQYNALLMPHLKPGQTLHSIYLSNPISAINIYAEIIKKLDHSSNNQSNFSHISDWLAIIDQTDHNKLSPHLLRQAIILKNKLLTTSTKEFVLHGDLHQQNILSDHNNWTVIDPKGIIGELEFEVACFDYVHNSELNKENISDLFNERVRLMALKMTFDPIRLKEWIFVRLILGACWMIEDNMQPDHFLNIIQKTLIMDK